MLLHISIDILAAAAARKMLLGTGGSGVFVALIAANGGRTKVLIFPDDGLWKTVDRNYAKCTGD